MQETCSCQSRQASARIPTAAQAQPQTLPPARPLQELRVSPQLLASHAIPVVKVVHNPREFVVVFPGAYRRWAGGQVDSL